MSTGIRKKIVGLIAGGSLTLLGVFLPADGVSAANLKTLLKKDFWISVGASAFYDQLANPLLGKGLGENDELIASTFNALGLKTFAYVGGGVLYTDTNGKIADNDFASDALGGSEKVSSKPLSISLKIQGRSPENARYLVHLDTISAKTINEIFNDEAVADVDGFRLETDTNKLTGEQMYAFGFSFAFIDDEFAFGGPGFRSKPMKTEHVPEPITIFGSAIGLGFGALFKKEHSRKQKKVKSLEKQKLNLTN
jgi:hypothetical protein